MLVSMEAAFRHYEGFIRIARLLRVFTGVAAVHLDALVALELQRNGIHGVTVSKPSLKRGAKQLLFREFAFSQKLRAPANWKPRVREFVERGSSINRDVRSVWIVGGPLCPF